MESKDLRDKYYKKQLEKYKYIRDVAMEQLNVGLNIDSISQGSFIGGVEFEKYFNLNMKDKQEEINEQIEQYIESRIKEYKDRAQEVEGLVLLWRKKYKRQIIKNFADNQVNAVPNDFIKQLGNKELEEFDEHFNISSKRSGEIK